MKGQLNRLIELIERRNGIMFESTHRSPLFSLQPTLHSLVRHSRPSRVPYILVASNVPTKVYLPNWQLQTPISTMAPTSVEIPRPISQANS